MTKFGLCKVSAVALLAAFGVACGDIGPNGGLTNEEAAAVGNQVDGAAAGGVAAGVGSGFNAPAAQPSAPPESRSFSFTHSRECSGGGTLEVSGTMEGTLDRETRTGTLTSQATMIATACVITHGERSITISTIPEDHIQKTGEVLIENGQHSGTFTVKGAFAWEKSNGDAGECEIDITMTIGPEGRSRTGTICGRDVAFTHPKS